MKAIAAVLLGGLLLSGCVHRHVTVVDSTPSAEVEVYEDPGDEIYLEDEGCEPVWDGHTFVVVESHTHGTGCGHFFHHNSWHLYPHDWVYAEVGYSHCGDTGGFYHGGHPWARVWDGLAFIMLHGHVHGHGCGHHYHHGCWNTHPSDYVHVDRRRGHFNPTPSRHHGDRHESAGRREPRELRSVVAPARPGSPVTREGREALAAPAAAGSRGRVETMGRRPEPARVEAPRQDEQPRRVEAAGRREAQRREQPQRVEQPKRQEPPRRLDPPQRREQPQRIEPQKKQEPPRRIEPPRRQEAPQRIEQPKKQEAPRRIEQPKKQEQPKRIEPPQRREAPKKQDPPQRREAPKEKEKRR